MRLRILSLVTLIALCATVPARSQDGRGVLRDVCLADYKRLCASVPRGAGRIRKCMAENSDKLTPACKAALGSQTKSN
jgi:hypothetical protein